MAKRRVIVRPGDRYGMLTVISEAEREASKRMALCRCDCGRDTTVRLEYLRSRHTTSCGCLRKDRNHTRRTHGQSKTRLYRTWHGMKVRCQDQGCRSFRDYGARGISVCAEWTAFEPFYAWAMANGYADDLTIDRIDCDGDYEPGNCRWATRLEQMNNKRTNRLISFNGRIGTASQLARGAGIPVETVYSRLASGWPSDKLLLPRGAYRKNMSARRR